MASQSESEAEYDQAHAKQNTLEVVSHVTSLASNRKVVKDYDKLNTNTSPNAQFSKALPATEEVFAVLNDCLDLCANDKSHQKHFQHVITSRRIIHHKLSVAQQETIRLQRGLAKGEKAGRKILQKRFAQVTYLSMVPFDGVEALFRKVQFRRPRLQMSELLQVLDLIEVMSKDDLGWEWEDESGSKVEKDDDLDILAGNDEDEDGEGEGRPKKRRKLVNAPHK